MTILAPNILCVISLTFWTLFQRAESKTDSTSRQHVHWFKQENNWDPVHAQHLSMHVAHACTLASTNKRKCWWPNFERYSQFTPFELKNTKKKHKSSPWRDEGSKGNAILVVKSDSKLLPLPGCITRNTPPHLSMLKPAPYNLMHVTKARFLCFHCSSCETRIACWGGNGLKPEFRSAAPSCAITAAMTLDNLLSVLQYPTCCPDSAYFAPNLCPPGLVCP